jgi:TPR repeat protein
MLSTMRGRWLIFLVGLGCGVTGWAQGHPPDLPTLKAAAEKGDPEAQFEYARALPASHGAEQLDWFYRAARAGYAPAQEALGSHFASAALARPAQRMTDLRESVRWSSRAAYAGIYTAQLRIAQFYRQGEALPRDLISAYIWMRLGVNRSPYGIIYQSSLAQLIGEMSPAQRAEADERLRKFQVKPLTGLNPVEADLIFTQLHLDATPAAHGALQVVINGVPFASGETKELKLDGESVRLVCFSIDEKSVLVSLAGTSFIHWLKR